MCLLFLTIKLKVPFSTRMISRVEVARARISADETRRGKHGAEAEELGL
jgi:hypothetical protein